MKRIQIESGVRNVAIAEYKEHQIRVVTGYEIRTDHRPAHVYLTPDRAQEAKVEGDVVAGSMQEGFDAGFAIGINAVDQVSK